MADEGSSLLALPDPCLLQVLQCCAAHDQRSLFSAARAHSKLHQAAVMVLRSITLRLSGQRPQQQMDGMTVYLGKHGQLLDSLELTGILRPRPHLRQLPPQLQLSSLQLRYLSLQLQPGNGCQGVLGAAAALAALKQLRLIDCVVLDSGAAEALAAALSQLPAGLEHLSISGLLDGGESVQFPSGVLQQLQHLTYLELCCIEVVRPDEASLALQPLQALTRLVGLRLGWLEQAVVTSSILSGMQHLTLLEVLYSMEVEPGALAGKTQLQHLALLGCQVLGGAAGVAQLLSHLQPLQQLTHLSVYGMLHKSYTPASAYAALTASSKLQHLDISNCTLPAGVWQHLFPTGRQLSNLQSLSITGALEPIGECALAPEGSRLVSCCPGLRSIKMWCLQCSAELLAPLQGLSGLQRLHCDWNYGTAEFVQAVCQLTGLRELGVAASSHLQEQGSLLQLTELQQLTMLEYDGRICNHAHGIHMQGGCHGRKLEPVWRQLLQLHLDHPDPEVAQQAAAALAQ